MEGLRKKLKTVTEQVVVQNQEEAVAEALNFIKKQCTDNAHSGLSSATLVFYTSSQTGPFYIASSNDEVYIDAPVQQVVSEVWRQVSTEFSESTATYKDFGDYPVEAYQFSVDGDKIISDPPYYALKIKW